MKYTPKERLEIGRRIYEREMTCQAAAEIFGIHKHTAKRYLYIALRKSERGAGRAERGAGRSTDGA